MFTLQYNKHIRKRKKERNVYNLHKEDGVGHRKREGNGTGSFCFSKFYSFWTILGEWLSAVGIDQRDPSVIVSS